MEPATPTVIPYWQDLLRWRLLLMTDDSRQVWRWPLLLGNEQHHSAPPEPEAFDVKLPYHFIRQASDLEALAEQLATSKASIQTTTLLIHLGGHINRVLG